MRVELKLEFVSPEGLLPPGWHLNIVSGDGSSDFAHTKDLLLQPDQVKNMITMLEQFENPKTSKHLRDVCEGQEADAVGVFEAEIQVVRTKLSSMEDTLNQIKTGNTTILELEAAGVDSP